MDRTFWGQIDKSNLDRVSAGVDAQRNLIAWLFPGQNSSGGQPNKMYLYHWPTQDFTEVEFDGNLVFSALDVTDNIEVLGAFDSANLFGRFDSATTPAGLLESGDYKFNDAGRTRIHGIRPHVVGEFAVGGSTNIETEAAANLETEGGAAMETEEPNVSVAIAGRKRLSLAVEYDSIRSMTALGECTGNNENEYQRIKVAVAGGLNWTSISGVTVEVTQGGKV